MDYMEYALNVLAAYSPYMNYSDIRILMHSHRYRIILTTGQAILDR